VSTRPRDDGKAALFSSPQPRTRTGTDSGRRAVFSAPPRRRGSVVVECQTCEARTPVPLVRLPQGLIPSLWLPLPGRAYSRLMRCPACGRPAWCRIHWRAALG
jgi:hypothetical protein